MEKSDQDTLSSQESSKEAETFDPIAMLSIAEQYFQMDEFEEVDKTCEEILSKDPTFAYAWELRALMDLKRGQYDEALEMIDKAIAINDKEPNFHCDKGQIFMVNGDAVKAEESYKQALALNPPAAEESAIYFSLGNLYHAQGLYEKSIEQYEARLALEPNCTSTYHNICHTCLKMGDIERALDGYKEILLRDPGDIMAHSYLGALNLRQGNYDEAISNFTVVQQLHPESSEAHHNLGIAYGARGSWEEAIAAHQRALEIEPGLVKAHQYLGIAYEENNMLYEAMQQYENVLRFESDDIISLYGSGMLYWELGDVSRATTLLEQQQKLAPLAKTKISLATMLPIIYSSNDHIKRSREQLDMRVSALEGEQLSIDPREVCLTHFSLPYQGLDSKALQEKVVALYRRSCQLTGNFYTPKESIPKQASVGFVIDHVENNDTAELIKGYIANMPRDNFEVVAVFLQKSDSEENSFIKDYVDFYHEFDSDVDTMAESIAKLRFDVLVYPEVGREKDSFLLAMNRLAPVQCVLWGAPMTTGMDTIDYFISGSALETKGSEKYYTEQLVKLDSLPTYFYKPQQPSTNKEKQEYGLSEQDNVYLILNELPEIHPDFDKVISEILTGDNNGKVVLQEGKFKEWTELLKERFQYAFADNMDRVVFVPRCQDDDLLNLIAIADVVLDPVYNGSKANIYRTLAVGTPLVTIPKEYTSSRVGAACCELISVTDGIVSDTEQYVNTALKFGTDKEYRNGIKDKILAANSVLYEDQQAVNNFAAVLQEALTKL